MIRFIQLLLLLTLPYPNWAQNPVKPSPAQISWHDTNFYLFFHFGPNTFTNMEWGHGTETEDVFNPDALNCEQWCRVAKAAGAKGVIITAKHHDGFCLWPSAYSTHTVRESPWKNGQGDVLRDLADACQRNDLKLGFYLSPWDRNHPKYGTPEYNDVYANTLRELLSNYGDLFEIWWDGANGEGPNGKKQTYDFHRFEKIAARLQPGAVIFSDIGPGCRWAGNEQGTVNETNWCMLDTAGFGRGATGPPSAVLQTGQPEGKLWIPAECDVSIRPGWFYHPEEDEKVKTPEQLFDIYLQSVGRGANLILNVPPDRHGLIHQQDSIALAGFGAMLQSRFSHNLALGKKVRPYFQMSLFARPSKTRQLTDNDPNTYAKGNQFEMHWPRPKFFNTILLREYLPDGQFVRSCSIEAWTDGQWHEIARSTTVGNKKAIQFPMVNSNRIRIQLETSHNYPARLSEWQVYRWE
ncbi:MAG: alpha-L-fucosidase [Lewinellaceae bacterium]|nr:alpha-L-fucosidase [Lewinellaceae bacterium]